MSSIYLICISDVSSIKLWRYEDPLNGPRKLPSFESPYKGKVVIEPETAFVVDVEKSTITIKDGAIDLGSKIVYSYGL